MATTEQLVKWFEACSVKGGGNQLPSYDKLRAHIEEHPFANTFLVDDKLKNMLLDVERIDDTYDSDYALRLVHKQALRRVLILCQASGQDVDADLSYN